MSATPEANAQEAASQSPHGVLDESLTCTDCHTATSWTPLRNPVQFDHGEVSEFSLLGRHKQTECSSCHTTLDFTVAESLAETGCVSCHEDVHAGELSTSCASCHTEESFLDVDGLLIHSGTTFPLVGAHVQTTCESCHRNGDRAFQTALDPSCDSCHLPDYENARSIDHVAADFPLQCQNCHNEYVWNGVIFDHLLASNGFELVGAHQGLSCSNCHSEGATPSIFGSVSQNDCISCHQPDYDDEHGGSGFPTTCIDCHSVDTWDDAMFDHVSVSGGFELLGAHTPLSCESCHVQPGFDLIFTPTDQNDCISCHQPDYNDEHAGSGFPTTCIDCHSADTWNNAMFDHATSSGGFELLGAHTPLSCESCHVQPGFDLIFTPTNQNDCVSCHQPDYNEEHSGSGFPTTCIDCHSTDTWENATFDHAANAEGFELLGAHAPLSCESCHIEPGFDLIFTPSDQNDCISCHQPDYDTEHAGSGIPTTCLDCHNNVNFAESTFDHDSDFFPIHSGEHMGEWSNCQDCHTSSVDFSVFTCLSCHAHEQSEMDDKHDDISAYIYESLQCFSCHPSGEK